MAGSTIRIISIGAKGEQLALSVEIEPDPRLRKVLEILRVSNALQLATLADYKKAAEEYAETLVLEGYDDKYSPSFPKDSKILDKVAEKNISLIVGRAVALALADVHVREVDEAFEKISIDFRAKNQLNFLQGVNPESILVMAGMQLCSLVPIGNTPDSIGAMIEAKEKALDLAGTQLRDRVDTCLLDLTSRVESIINSNETIPPWLDNSSAMYEWSMKRRRNSLRVKFEFYNAAITTVHRKGQFKKLKNPVPYPPQLVIETVVNASNCYNDGFTYDPTRPGEPFRSFHFSSGGNCVGNASFPKLRVYSDVDRWYEIIKQLLDLVNMDSPFHPEYIPHAKLKADMCVNGIFSWDAPIFRTEFYKPINLDQLPETEDEAEEEEV